jgi:glucokinase
LILDDISQAVRFRDEGVRDDDVFTSDVTNDPEAELLAKERGKLQLIKKHEANIAELMDRLRRECTPEQRVTFESLIKSCGLDEIYHEFERGERKGRLDLSPKGVAQVTGMQIDTFNKHKRALKAIASRMGSFRRATSNWDR